MGQEGLGQGPGVGKVEAWQGGRQQGSTMEEGNKGKAVLAMGPPALQGTSREGQGRVGQVKRQSQ